MNVIWKVRLEIISVLTFHIHCRIWVGFRVRDLDIILLRAFVNAVEIVAGNALLFLWPYMKLYSSMYRETI
jgi:hypothetical protein